ERGNAEFVVQRGDRLRSDALQAQQVEHRRGKLGDELAMVCGVAGLCDLADAPCEVFADARDFAKAGRIECRQLVRMVGDDVCRVAVGPNLERIVSLDLEKISNLAKYPGNCQIIQPGALPSRCGSPVRGLLRRQELPPLPTARAVDRSRRGSHHGRRYRPWRPWRPLPSRAQSAR